jgi:hypothetical protein
VTVGPNTLSNSLFTIILPFNTTQPKLLTVSLTLVAMELNAGRDLLIQYPWFQLSVVYRGPKINLKIIEINDS